jgi:dihydrofolate reductase
MIKAIFAVDRQGGMGKNGSLPWGYDKEDMQWFRNATTDQIVVMGANTWLDPIMPKPLANRHCVVVTNQPIDRFPEAHDVIVGSMLLPSLRFLQNDRPDKDIWIIGGAKLINNTQHLFQQIHLTVFDDQFDCDVSINHHELLKRFDLYYETYSKNKIFSVWNNAKL